MPTVSLPDSAIFCGSMAAILSSFFTESTIEVAFCESFAAVCVSSVVPHAAEPSMTAAPSANAATFFIVDCALPNMCQRSFSSCACHVLHMAKFCIYSVFSSNYGKNSRRFQTLTLYTYA